jgi:hypothetical protein
MQCLPVLHHTSVDVEVLAVPVVRTELRRIRRFTPQGARSIWQIDDVYVDPMARR